MRAGAAPPTALASPAELQSAGTLLDRRVQERAVAGRRFFGAEAGRLARLCHAMAERFARGGRLVALAATPAARSDARHVAVEFVHPVIVGKRALPALGLAPEGGDIAAQADALVASGDIVLAFGTDAGPAEARAALNASVAALRARGCLTVDFAAGGAAEWSFDPPAADPFVRQEIVETLYHVLWELVHLFFEHPGLLEGGGARTSHDAGGASFLYPFLAQQEHDLDAVLDDVRRSVVMKSDEVAALRARTVHRSAAGLVDAAATLRRALDGGGTLLAIGNGGSATDAMDAVADLRDPPHGWPARAALDLTEDAAILTALANDIGPDALFARQVIAWGRPGDALLAFSTSGDSRNVIAALEEARRRGLASVAFVGYEGGRILADGLADHVILSPSQHIPRIQEAQATAWHLLRELIEAG